MNVIAEMLLDQPAPSAIWATLMLLTFPAMLLLGMPEGLRHPRQAAREVVALLREQGDQRRERAAQAAQVARYADEVRTAAGRAVAAAERWQQVWQLREQELGQAWQAWLDADSRLRRLQGAATWRQPWTVNTCQEYAARERFLHRAVTDAAQRGELPAAAVADALAGRAGWDPRLHPVEQELVIARVSAAWLRYRFDEATAAERTTWHDAELARRAATGLVDEARTAQAQAADLAGQLPSRSRTDTSARRRAIPALRPPFAEPYAG